MESFDHGLRFRRETDFMQDDTASLDIGKHFNLSQVDISASIILLCSC